MPTGQEKKEMTIQPNGDEKDGATYLLPEVGLYLLVLLCIFIEWFSIAVGNAVKGSAWIKTLFKSNGWSRCQC